MQQIPRHTPRFTTANAEWKAQWDSVLSWSMVLAVAIHASVFAFWPAWENSNVFLDADLELLGTAWMALYAPPPIGGGGGGGGGIEAPPMAMLEEPDSLPPEVDAGTGLGSAQRALAALPERLRERLAGRNGPVPTIVRLTSAPRAPALEDNPANTVEEEEQEEEEEEGASVTAEEEEEGASVTAEEEEEGASVTAEEEEEGASVTAEEEEEGASVTAEDPSNDDLALLLETSPLDLSRLSAVRPQIVLPGTSAWILIRNPEEVDQFMNGNFYRLDSEVQRLVNVAVWIDEWGSVEWAEISKSSGLGEIDEIALALFNEVATFRPARDRGVRVSMSAIFSVPFPW